ncbi:universal stress protein [Streptomyces phaeochromogenes]
MPKPIVVGLDGSRESVAAAHWAAREALFRGRSLRLVHAWEGLPSDDEPAALPELKMPGDRARGILRTTLDQISEAHPQLRVSAERINRLPVPALADEAEKAELLVLGNQGLGGLGAFFMGSVSLASVAQVRQPVVLVRADWTAAREHVPDDGGRPCVSTPYREVLLALDPKHECGELLDFALQAAEHRGGTLSVIHAWQPPHSLGGPNQEGDAPGRRDTERALAEVIDPWRKKYPSVDVQVHTCRGRPALTVTHAAQGAGLLVVGRRIRLATMGSHMGRVVRQAMHRVACPVAVIAHD